MSGLESRLQQPEKLAGAFPGVSQPFDHKQILRATVVSGTKTYFSGWTAVRAITHWIRRARITVAIWAHIHCSATVTRICCTGLACPARAVVVIDQVCPRQRPAITAKVLDNRRCTSALLVADRHHARKTGIVRSLSDRHSASDEPAYNRQEKTEFHLHHYLLVTFFRSQRPIANEATDAQIIAIIPTNPPESEGDERVPTAFNGLFGVDEASCAVVDCPCI